MYESAPGGITGSGKQTFYIVRLDYAFPRDMYILRTLPFLDVS